MAKGRDLPRIMLHFLLGWAAGTALLLSGPMAALAAPDAAGPKDKTLVILKQVYAEVKEMGPYPGEDFVRREFFVGEDDDDTNKDVHVAVLIQPFDSREKMTVRVTEMVKDPGNIRARLARNSRMLVCLIAGDRLEIQVSAYDENELEELAPEILTAIQNKKRLLKLGTAYQFPYYAIN